VDPGDELVEVVDESDRVVEVVSRRSMRDRRLLHRCTYIVVLNGGGELYVHRRTETKDVNPGFYDVTAGGVNEPGETYDACAAREVAEELGVTATPTFRFMHRYSGPDGEVWGAAYDVLWDGEIVWQPSEVAWGRFLSLDEVDAMIARERFCADALEVFGRWRLERSVR
jgi:8-oxo-dGTP pyrophosphatase MutT (NUDIX family)